MIPRTLGPRLRQLAVSYPTVFLTGPRQSGKTTLARATLPDFAYISLEDMQRRRDATEDPRGFLAQFDGGGGVILDEAQRAPDLFSYLQGFIDERRGGPFVLTGSQHFLLSEKIGQSLAGRAAILELLPFSIAELVGRTALEPERFVEGPGPSERPSFTLDEILLAGTFPPVHDRRLEPATWYDSYLRTYVERDVRSLTNVGDLDTFARFVALCAGHSGQLVNTSSLASDAGVSHTTVRRWLSILRTSYVLDLLPPHHTNFRKRLVKRPKLHITDSGLLCHLLGIRDVQALRVHPLRGAIFESFVVSEVRKAFLHHGRRSPLSFWRDSNGREVDLLVDNAGRLVPIEVKVGATATSDMTRTLEWFLELSGEDDGILVYGGEDAHTRRGVQLRPWWSCS